MSIRKIQNAIEESQIKAREDYYNTLGLVVRFQVGTAAHYAACVNLVAAAGQCIAMDCGGHEKLHAAKERLEKCVRTLIEAG